DAVPSRQSHTSGSNHRRANNHALDPCFVFGKEFYAQPPVSGVLPNIVVTETMLGTRSGWQLYWVITNTIVLLAVVGVSNLYVQGGMRLRHVAWFAFVLGFYDGIFAFAIPILGKLADRFEGQPLDPSIGFAMGP